MRQNLAALASRLQAELADLQTVVQRTNHLLDKTLRQGDVDYLDGVALNLHGFYAGAERIFLAIARDIDQTVPSDSTWPRSLLMQMSAPLNNTRPAVLQQSTRLCLDEYRAFRHVVRNVYTFSLRPSRLQELAADLPACYDSLVADISAFIGFLDAL